MSAITVVLPLICAFQHTRGQLPSCPRRKLQPHSPSFVQINARGVDFTHVRVRDHSCAPPCLCTSTHKGSTSPTSVSMITATLPPCLWTSTHEGLTSLASTSAITATLVSVNAQLLRD